MNYTKHVFIIIWLIYYVIEHLILLKIKGSIVIKEGFHQWFTYFLIKNLLCALLQLEGLTKVKLYQMKNQPTNCTNQSLESLKNGK